MVQRAVLIRPVMVLDDVPAAKLSGVSVLVVLGSTDVYRQEGDRLAAILTDAGALVETVVVPGGHEISPDDARAVREWLAGL